MKSWVFLLIAIIAEVIATSTLKQSAGFTKLWPSLIAATGFITALYFMSLAMQTLPISIVYAVWSGVGIALISLIGWLFYGEVLDWAALLGICLIASGIVVMNAFSGSIGH